jgi:integrase
VAETPDSSIILDTCSTITTLQESERVRQLRATLRSPNTSRAYASDWRSFEAWCLSEGVEAGRADDVVVANYLAVLADEGCAPGSIARVYSGLLATLRSSAPETWPPGLRPYRIAQVLKGIRRDNARLVVRKRPLTDVEVAKIVSNLGHDLKATRDRALLLVGVMGGFRRSELVGLDVETLQVTDAGLQVYLPKSKTDQEGDGRTVGILAQNNSEECPIRALGEWTDAASIISGPIFRPVVRGRAIDRRLNDRAVARIVKETVASIGLDADDFSGHSMRAGFVTTAARQGKSLESIMKQTGHKSIKQLMEYIRHATVFVDNATSGFMPGKKGSP